jgi:hypothetical protein
MGNMRSISGLAGEAFGVWRSAFGGLQTLRSCTRPRELFAATNCATLSMNLLVSYLFRVAGQEFLKMRQTSFSLNPTELRFRGRRRVRERLGTGVP